MSDSRLAESKQDILFRIMPQITKKLHTDVVTRITPEASTN